MGDDEMNERHGEIKKLARKGPVQGALYIISSLVAFYAVARCVMAAFDWLAGGSSASEEDSEVVQATLPALMAFISGNLARAMVPSTKHGISIAGEAALNMPLRQHQYDILLALLLLGYLTRKVLPRFLGMAHLLPNGGFGLALTSVIIANVVESPKSRKDQRCRRCVDERRWQRMESFLAGFEHTGPSLPFHGSSTLCCLCHFLMRCCGAFFASAFGSSRVIPCDCRTAQSVGMLYAAGNRLIRHDGR